MSREAVVTIRDFTPAVEGNEVKTIGEVAGSVRDFLKMLIAEAVAWFNDLPEVQSLKTGSSAGVTVHNLTMKEKVIFVAGVCFAVVLMAGLAAVVPA
ncbi:MAG: hypothetical protein ACOYIK_00115 [Coriobacteriales bacterium]|jgi:hypothetical protein